MKKKTQPRAAAIRKKAVKRNQLNMTVNPRVFELLEHLKKSVNLKLAMKGRMSYPALVWKGLSLLAKQYKIKLAKQQGELFN